jgi:hypothetical protein
MRTSGGPLLIVIKPTAKEKTHDLRCYFLFKKTVDKNCIFYQRLLPPTF